MRNQFARRHRATDTKDWLLAVMGAYLVAVTVISCAVLLTATLYCLCKWASGRWGRKWSGGGGGFWSVPSSGGEGEGEDWGVA